MLFALAAATFVSTLLGGLFALRLHDRLHLILGFSAGAVVGLSFFDLMPEALELGGPIYGAATIVTTIAVGFLAYLLLDRFVLLHGHQEHGGVERRGDLGAASLSMHSFLDGVGIGLGFQVSPALGLVVAVAVLAHDFSDGINTVNFILKNGGSRRQAFSWLTTDALAPVIGVLSTLFFSVPAPELAVLLALFAGFFLYIGASDLIPESHHAHPARWTTVTTLCGAAFLYLIVRLAG